MVEPSTLGEVNLRPKDGISSGTALFYGAGVNGSLSNTAVVALSGDGKFDVKTQTSVNLVIDIQGYFTAGQTWAGGFVPLMSPARIVDTRSGHGLPQAKLTADSTTTVNVAGLGGVPANATAVFVNLTVVNPAGGDGFLTAYPADKANPSTSLNFAAASTTAIGTTVALSETSPTTGKMKVYRSGGGAQAPIDLVVDIAGYFIPPSPINEQSFQTGFERVVADASVGAGETVTFPIAGVGTVPGLGSGIEAIAANIQVVQPNSVAGFVSLWADSIPRPATSLANYTGNTIRSNFFTSALGPNGGVQVYNHGPAPVRVFIDVQGWFLTPFPALEVDLSASPEEDDVVSDDPDIVEDVSLNAAAGHWFVEDANGNKVEFPEGPNQTWPTRTEARSTWWDAVCTGNESRYSIIKQYPRQTAHPRMVGGSAKMYCGKKTRWSEQPTSEAPFGIRHIRDDHNQRHKRQFGQLAYWEGRDWGSYMSWAIGWVLKEPRKITDQDPAKANRFCFEKKFGLPSPNGTIEDRYVVVLLGKTGVRIMTTFPRKTAYCKGDVLLFNP